MRITRTPFRISFLGGGSDYPAWHSQHIGMVLGATINRFCYLMYQPDQEKFRINYTEREECEAVEQIQHPAIKAVLEYLGQYNPCSITHASDLPSRSGIGSSSAFVVGLLNAVEDQECNWQWLAHHATGIEQEVLKEPVGGQDQVLCAKGGINQIVWHPSDQKLFMPSTTRTLELSPDRLNEFHSHLLLFRTHPRDFHIPEPLTFDTPTVQRLAHLAKEGADLLLSNRDIRDFGYLLNESWMLKRGMSSSITTDTIDRLYYRAVKAGAIGGKLLGAGGGGFMLVFAEPDKHIAIKEALGYINHVPFEFEFEGSKVVYED